jgi:preprotein translocase subunit SecA
MLARPGPIWGHYPLFDSTNRAGPVSRHLESQYWRDVYARKQASAVAAAIAQRLQATPQPSAGFLVGSGALRTRIQQLRASLRRRGVHSSATQSALLTAAQVAAQTHGLVAHPAQLKSAWYLIHQSLVELPTGEGKSLTAALAAAVLGLADIPVHLMTANDYLAQRDAESFAPLFGALGLRVAATADLKPANEQRAAFACDITYCTTRTAAFAYLRDIQLTQNSSERILRGLCCAIVDEADVAMLDEARMPLILAQQINEPAARVRAFHAMTQARQLESNRDFALDHGRAVLNASGHAKLEALRHTHQNTWINARHHREQIEFALRAIHGLVEGRDYVVKAKQIELLDIHSGRIATGRQLSHGLHDMLAVKEGLPIPKQTSQIASNSYARFFSGYYRLSGLSGTLKDSRAELARTYRRPVIVVKPHRPSQRRVIAPAVFSDAPSLLSALVSRIEQCYRSQQPVLLATQDVAQTQWVAAALEKAQLPCRTLTAQDEATEADIIAAAGRPGAITVATQLAGRGTDIHLSEASIAAGGLFVISLQINRNRRTDRQVFGRSARQGQPGATQQWCCAQLLAPWVPSLPGSAQRWVNALVAKPTRRRVLLAHKIMQRAWEQDDAFARSRANLNEQHWAKRLLFSTVQG